MALDPLCLFHVIADGCPRSQELPTEYPRPVGAFIQPLRAMDDIQGKGKRPLLDIYWHLFYRLSFCFGHLPFYFLLLPSSIS